MVTLFIKNSPIRKLFVYAPMIFALDSTQPQSINFMTGLPLGLGYRALVFASKTNLELGSRFAEV